MALYAMNNIFLVLISCIHECLRLMGINIKVSIAPQCASTNFYPIVSTPIFYKNVIFIGKFEGFEDLERLLRGWRGSEKPHFLLIFAFGPFNILF